jgi:hypothetical protein
MDPHTIHYLRLEAAELNRAVKEAYSAADDAAFVLRHAGGAALAALAEPFAAAPADVLHEHASHLRGAALHAMTVVLALVAEAGKLEALAQVRRSATSESPDGS